MSKTTQKDFGGKEQFLLWQVLDRIATSMEKGNELYESSLERSCKMDEHIIARDTEQSQIARMDHAIHKAMDDINISANTHLQRTIDAVAWESKQDLRKAIEEAELKPKSEKE